ncbi:LysM peptidoglycan-binding domain-containing protein [Acidaminococcus timonensis]|uniref:LysM peptidoglycan-binding domain-containing protein n=1 Tax=Acidaminococcus timonensis TaxID=1871002 RepID=UPI000AD7C7BD|nr:LysM domain-containing protein [Acidaminococcus timonensis]
MELNKICAAAIITLGALTMACHAGQAVQERRNPQYTMVSRRVMAGETLWEICSKVNQGREDVWEVIDRVRLDNDIKDPGALEPGQIITIRVKK